jgi:hypothetical protein
MDSICQAIGHSRSYYSRFSAICDQCYEYNKRFEREEDV